jgi:hypothetical protein
VEPSILNSTKKVLGLPSDYTPFDLDVLTHINSTLATIHQLGVTDEVKYVTDENDVWDDLGLDRDQVNWARTYIFLKVRLLFDPPGTSFLLEAMNKQIEEHEWRLNLSYELKQSDEVA